MTLPFVSGRVAFSYTLSVPYSVVRSLRTEKSQIVRAQGLLGYLACAILVLQWF